MLPYKCSHTRLFSCSFPLERPRGEAGAFCHAAMLSHASHAMRAEQAQGVFMPMSLFHSTAAACFPQPFQRVRVSGCCCFMFLYNPVLFSCIILFIIIFMFLLLFSLPFRFHQSSLSPSTVYFSKAVTFQVTVCLPGSDEASSFSTSHAARAI